MGRFGPDVDTTRLTSLKATNLAPEVDTADVERIFAKYPSFVTVYMPINLHTRAHRGFAFVRLQARSDAERAIEELDGIVDLKGQIMKVSMCIQNSFFTQDTGYITNEALDTLPERTNQFVPGMPESHFETLHYQNRDLSNQYTLRVGNLNEHVTNKHLEDTFAQFGELASIHRPFDKGIYPIKPRNFAFVRFVNPDDGKQAFQTMNYARLEGCEMHITIPHSVQIFSQNESRDLPPAIRPRDF
jgi:RNA recognition motif-containing protein